MSRRSSLWRYLGLLAFVALAVGIVAGPASAKQLSVVVKQVENGGKGMPPFKGTLTQKQINDVATYVVKDITHGKVP